MTLDDGCSDPIPFEQEAREELERTRCDAEAQRGVKIMGSNPHH